jgi:hypothetical protein
MAMHIRFFAAGIAVISAALVASCAPQMSGDVVTYNKVVSNSGNQILLLNIIRASQRVPTYYSRLETNTDTLGYSAPNTLSVPFSKSVTHNGTNSVGSPAKSTVLAAVTAGLGLTPGDSSALGLQTLDDQKYQNGMMKALDLKTLKIFMDEGYQHDMLMLLTISSITVSPKMVRDIDAAVDAKCKTPVKLDDGIAYPNELEFSNQTCAFIQSLPFSDYLGSDPTQNTLASCIGAAGHAPYVNRLSNGSFLFANDPARELLPAGGKGNHHPEICFELLMQDLLALGIGITDGGKAFDAIDSTVPVGTAGDGTFRAETIKERVKFVSDAARPKFLIACESKDQDPAFQLSFGYKNAAGVPIPQLTKLADDLNPAPPKGDDALCNGTTDTNASEDLTKTRALNPAQISFAVRSLEAIIYYLGETARAEQSDPNLAKLLRVAGRSPEVSGAGYYDALFVLRKGDVPSDAWLSVDDDQGATYYIPALCSGDIVSGGRAAGTGCSAEYPDHESLPVMTLVNQIWGLEKESTSGPSGSVISIPSTVP